MGGDLTAGLVVWWCPRQGWDSEPAPVLDLGAARPHVSPSIVQDYAVQPLPRLVRPSNRGPLSSPIQSTDRIGESRSRNSSRCGTGCSCAAAVAAADAGLKGLARLELANVTFARSSATVGSANAAKGPWMSPRCPCIAFHTCDLANLKNALEAPWRERKCPAGDPGP